MQSLPTISTDWLLDWARLLLAEYDAELNEGREQDAEAVMDRLQPVLLELFERGVSITLLLDRVSAARAAAREQQWLGPCEERSGFPWG